MDWTPAVSWYKFPDYEANNLSSPSLGIMISSLMICLCHVQKKVVYYDSDVIEGH